MHIYILPQCSTTAASVLNSAGMDAQFERSCCAISRGILNCFFTSLLYLFPDILAVLSLCGIALSIGEQLVLETYKGMGSTFKIQC